MTEYTPTTEHVRRGFAGLTISTDSAESIAEFDRWLAAYTAQVQADALRDAAVCMPHMAGEWMHSRWLRARADSLLNPNPETKEETA